MKVSFFGVLGAEPLGEGVAEDGSDGWSEGETSPFVHFKRSFWVMGNVCYKKAGGIAKNLHNLTFF